MGEEHVPCVRGVVHHCCRCRRCRCCCFVVVRVVSRVQTIGKGFQQTIDFLGLARQPKFGQKQPKSPVKRHAFEVKQRDVDVANAGVERMAVRGFRQIIPHQGLVQSFRLVQKHRHGQRGRGGGGGGGGGVGGRGVVGGRVGGRGGVVVWLWFFLSFRLQQPHLQRKGHSLSRFLIEAIIARKK